jgi:hypothetical protein
VPQSPAGLCALHSGVLWLWGALLQLGIFSAQVSK